MSSYFRLKALLPEFNSQSSKSPFAQLEVMLKLLSETQTAGWQQQDDSAASVSASSSTVAEEKKIKHWGIQIAGSLQEGIVESVTKKWHSQVYSRLPSHTTDNSSVNAV